MTTIGPQTALGDETHAAKYRAKGEDFRAAMNRVASALKDSDAHFHEFRDILLDMRFMPGGRVQTAMGSSKQVTAYNCFVSGTIEDSFVHDDGSIMQRATEAAATMRMGGGIGYDFSTLRPRNSLIKKLNSRTGGPLPFMGVFDAICKCVASAGERRGAQMGVLRVDHPDVEEFVDAKTEPGVLTGFNLSLAVTDDFMECVLTGRPFVQRFNGERHGEIDAGALWQKIMRNTWDHAEPGVIFIDTVNRLNNLWYCETIAATNPCGEQPLPPHGACLLGSFNLVRYMTRQGSRWEFDWDQFDADIAPVVRAMDNVVDRTIYPLPQQRAEALSKRRMGLGITALANTAEAMGMEYGSLAFQIFEAKVLDRLNRCAYRASVELAREKGAFPMYEDRYLSNQNSFVSQHFRGAGDEETLELIERYGIRNSHLTSIAPTGTISLAADNVSSAIEPVFSLEYERTIRMPDGVRVETVQDYGKRVFGVDGRTCDRVTAAQHVAVLTTAAQRVDSAVSKTCNVSPTMPWEEFCGIYEDAWRGGAKGCTTFNPGGERAGILVAKEEESDSDTGQSCRIDTATGRRECA